jgi:hypothetical protein
MATKPKPQTPSGQTGDCGCNDCKDKDNATQVSININRTALCKLLYNEQGTVSKLDTKFKGESELFQEKKCIFLNTEKNYRRYRNFEITTGTELIQTNVSIKASVAQIKDWNKNLNATLTALSKQVKDLKSKFGDLKDAACKLDSSYKDKCNIGQKKALTGIAPDNCPDPIPPIDACKDVSTDIEALICRPKGLALDIDSILQASSDVIGIQIFSNIDSLDPLQTDLTAKSSAFEKMISDAMKTRKTELDKLQDDLVTSVKTITQVGINRNSERAIFEGYYDATKFLCCPTCSCVPDDSSSTDKSNTAGNQGHNECDDECCPPRLKECEQAICAICDTVKTTFCCEADNPAPAPQKPPVTQESE